MRSVKILVLLMLLSTTFSCKKSVQNSLEKYFSDNVLNRDFVITYANDEGNIITNLYGGYTFVLQKGSDYYGGPLKVSDGTHHYTGTWTSNDDFGKLTIKLPATPPEFKFLTREWRYISKSIPILKFAPWGSNAQIELTMERR